MRLIIGSFDLFGQHDDRAVTLNRNALVQQFGDGIGELVVVERLTEVVVRS